MIKFRRRPPLDHSEKSIQKAFYSRSGRNYQCLIPNLNPINWTECDLLGITKAGYFHEVEIKLNRIDFRADKKKHVFIPSSSGHYNVKSPKFDEISNTDNIHRPNKFTYICPPGIIHTNDIPEEFGLIYVTEFGGLKEIRAPSFLHKNKVTYEFLMEITKKMDYRIWK